MTRTMPRSVRKFIRRKKQEFRKKFSPEEAVEKIRDLVESQKGSILKST